MYGFGSLIVSSPKWPWEGYQPQIIHFQKISCYTNTALSTNKNIKLTTPLKLFTLFQWLWSFPAVHIKKYPQNRFSCFLTRMIDSRHCKYLKKFTDCPYRIAKSGTLVARNPNKATPNNTILLKKRTDHKVIAFILQPTFFQKNKTNWHVQIVPNYWKHQVDKLIVILKPET